MNAKFLLQADSFINILTEEGFKKLRLLDAAISKARANQDSVFSNPLLVQLTLSNGSSLYDLMKLGANPTIGFKNDHFKMLIKYFWGTSPQQSSSWNAFSAEFQNQNNGMMGLPSNSPQCPIDKYVHDNPTWFEFHRKFLAINNQYIDWSTNSYFPNLEYSNMLLIQEVVRYRKAKSGRELSQPEIDQIKPDDFYKEIRAHASERELKDLASRIGSEVAARNFFAYEEDLSERERTLISRKDKPEIYSINKENRRLYLSIDFKSVAFEVCDHDGCHLGEFLFTGKNNGPAETDHGLRALT